MASEFIYLKMVKEWGGFKVGDVVRFGHSKGVGRIERGEGIEVPKQPAVNDPEKAKKRPAAETATMPVPAARETAEVTPIVTPKARAKTKKR